MRARALRNASNSEECILGLDLGVARVEDAVPQTVVCVFVVVVRALTSLFLIRVQVLVKRLLELLFDELALLVRHGCAVGKALADFRLEVIQLTVALFKSLLERRWLLLRRHLRLLALRLCLDKRLRLIHYFVEGARHHSKLADKRRLRWDGDWLSHLGLLLGRLRLWLRGWLYFVDSFLEGNIEYLALRLSRSSNRLSHCYNGFCLTSQALKHGISG